MFRITVVTALIAGFSCTPCNAEFRDPTQPAYPPPSATGTESNGAEGNNELVLSAILISSQSKRATINGINAKEGQTIEIEQAPALTPAMPPPTNTVSTGDKQNELLNKAMEFSNAKTNSPTQENVISSLGNVAGPLGGMIAPLLSSAIGSMDVPQLQGQSAAPAETSAKHQANAAQHAKTAYVPVRSIIIKIVSIHKNSVIIDQNGERKTLQLVNRSYKTARNKYQVHL